MARTQNEAPAAALTAQTKTAIFEMKKGTEVPEKFDGAEIKIRLAADTEDAAQAMTNMLALTGGSVQAVIDAFNGQGAALTIQKAVKTLANTDGKPKKDAEGNELPDSAPTVTVADLQAAADKVVITPVSRGKGEEKKAVTKAKVEKAEAIETAASDVLSDLRTLRDEDRDAAEAQLALMIRLKVVPADTSLDSI